MPLLCCGPEPLGGVVTWGDVTGSLADVGCWVVAGHFSWGRRGGARRVCGRAWLCARPCGWTCLASPALARPSCSGNRVGTSTRMCGGPSPILKQQT
eukprot:1184664-Prorocentrum_minimum.AAC.1